MKNIWFKDLPIFWSNAWYIRGSRVHYWSNKSQKVGSSRNHTKALRYVRGPQLAILEGLLPQKTTSIKHEKNNNLPKRRRNRMQKSDARVGIGILRGLGDSWKSLKSKNRFSTNTNNPCEIQRRICQKYHGSTTCLVHAHHRWLFEKYFRFH